MRSGLVRGVAVLIYMAVAGLVAWHVIEVPAQTTAASDPATEPAAPATTSPPATQPRQGHLVETPNFSFTLPAEPVVAQLPVALADGSSVPATSWTAGGAGREVIVVAADMGITIEAANVDAVWDGALGNIVATQQVVVVNEARRRRDDGTWNLHAVVMKDGEQATVAGFIDGSWLVFATSAEPDSMSMLVESLRFT